MRDRCMCGWGMEAIGTRSSPLALSFSLQRPLPWAPDLSAVTISTCEEEEELRNSWSSTVHKTDAVSVWVQWLKRGQN